MTLHFREANGGYIIFNFFQLENRGEVHCRYGNGETFSTCEKSFSDARQKTAEAFLASPERSRKVVYHFRWRRPLDNPKEIIMVIDDARLSGKRDGIHLRPDFDENFIDPSKIPDAAGLEYELTGLDFAGKSDHEIRAQKKFPGWRGGIRVVHEAYGATRGIFKDLSKIHVALEAEKRFRAEQSQGIGNLYLPCFPSCQATVFSMRQGY